MNIETITAQGQQLQDILSQVQSMRNDWSAKMESVTTVLKSIAALPTLKPFAMTVRTYGVFQHPDVVDITFGKVHSGLVRRLTNGTEAVTKHGGSLAFSQITTGKVLAIINFPSIEGVRDGRQAEQLGVFVPEEITEDTIYRMVGEFLRKIIAWELGTLD